MVVSLADAHRGYVDRTDVGLVEILAVGHGRGLTNQRLVRTAIGDRLRYVSHDADSHILTIFQEDAQTGLSARTTFERITDRAGFRSTTTITNLGTESITLQAVSSLTIAGLSAWLGDASETVLWTARSEWCAENRWSSEALTGQAGLPSYDADLHGQAARGLISRTSTSTWSTGHFLPMAVLENPVSGRAVAWQLEVSGPWHWELTSQFSEQDWIALGLFGPTDLYHSWLHTLRPGESFETVPASVVTSEDSFDGAIAELTEVRRASRVAPPADASKALIFNDYMNALMGDPTTARLLPLIDAASEVGARYFCIDAGWYDDGGDWWPSVGEWRPSTSRFGEMGLTGVLQYIRERGMRPGLWVEPEVVGVRSPIASALPDEAFMMRAGIRIREHDRYFLDFRSRAAREYLDGVFDRLIGEYGSEYFKWDYNVTPGTGPDFEAESPGDGLLGHVRAHLEWFTALRSRHPEVVFEACSSGAQRQDPAIVSRYDLQSTSDQQDYLRYPAISAAAPTIVPLEQAGNWAYPQSEMTHEQIAFNLVTGLSGRLYLSGNLDRLNSDQRALVREATDLYPAVISHHALATPSWPLGLPRWNDDVVCLASVGATKTLLFVWNRDEGERHISVPLTGLRGRITDVTQVYPASLPPWGIELSRQEGLLVLSTSGCGESARIFEIAHP